MSYPLEILSDYADISWGNTSITKASYVEKGYPAFSAAGQDGFLPDYEFDEDGIVLSAIGARCGKCFFAKKKWTAIKNTITITSKDTEKLNLTYLFHFVNNEKFWPQRGGGQPFIALGEARKVKIPVPDIDDQKRIAHLLGKVKGLIALRKQHLQQLDDLLKSVFLEMFGDPVRNEKGWNTVPFHRVGKFVSGGTPSKSREDYWSGVFPWVSPKDMKVLKIDDANDHISEKVFEETSLKRIAPGHLLIVVRGMILAHSFPVAINTVEIAINQDMKAIKPVKGVDVVYLQNCLTSLKRQILKLISTAGHGTRKFDSVAMQKLFIPKPPEDLQNQFASIVKKVEGIKYCYQQSLTNMESLYGALSQKAFKGELDLSRVPLPLGGMDRIEGEKNEADERVGILSAVELPDPENIARLVTAEGRKALIVQWAKAWIQQLGTFSVQHFMETAQQRLWDLVDTQDQDSTSLEYEEIQFGLVEYDELKAWVFGALEQGHMTQMYDDAKNHIQITTAKE